MKYEIGKGGSLPLVYITLVANEEIKIENGSMVYHDGRVALEGKMNSGGAGGLGGALKALGRSLTSGENFFITHAKGLADGALIAVAPSSIGQIKEISVGATQWRLNDGAFLACDGKVNYKMVRQSLGKALLAGTGGLFVMETSGDGTMLVSGHGDLIEIDLDGSKNFVVDNFHVVAWDAALNYEIKVASGVFGFTTGEGLVNEFRGRGKIIIQSRNLKGLADSIIPFIPRQTK